MNKMIETANNIVKKLEQHGTALIVGGAVRDITLNQIPKDIDIATNVSMNKIESMFKTHDIGKNKDFGIVVVVENGFDFEVAQFRSEGEYTDGRRPDQIQIEDSFIKDSERRDLTINAMGLDSNGKILDFFGGQDDLNNRIIKTVGDPNKRFSEDFIRMMRAIRFSSRFNFDIDDLTLQAIKDNAHNINNTAVERVVQELVKMAGYGGITFADTIVKMKDSGLLQHFLPEVQEMDHFDHDPKDHPEGNVFSHVLESLRGLDSTDSLVNLGILFHDIGKIKTFSTHTGKISFHNHPKVGIEIIESIAKRLKLDTKTKDVLTFCSENHMKMHGFLELSQKKAFDLMDNKNWNILVQVTKADALSNNKFNSVQWNKICDRIRDLTAKQASILNVNRLKQLINGELVMELRNIKQGKEVGLVIQKTLEWVINNEVIEPDEINTFIKSIKV